MFSRIRKKVLKSRNYESKQNSQFHDLEEEDDISDKSPVSNQKENRRSTNGFAKCLVPHLNGNPINCVCRRNVSPGAPPVEERSTDNGKGNRDQKRQDDKSSSDKSNSLTIGSCLNYYFKENDSCELDRKNKPTTLSVSTKGVKSKAPSEVTNSQTASKKADVLRSTSMKEKPPTLPLFSAGQRDINSGIDFKEFQRVFQVSPNSVADTNKTVTFETFGKLSPSQDVKPPMFLPVKTKKPCEDLLDPCDLSLHDSSLSFPSKGASLTSEEGAESGYGTQDDGTDRLARSISSSSESNAPDFVTDLIRTKCQISRESTGEEDVFHHGAESLEKSNVQPKTLSTRGSHGNIPPPKPARQVDISRPTPNMNIVIAEVHAEHFDEPHPCATTNVKNNILISQDNPNMDETQNKKNNQLSIDTFDINCNPKTVHKTVAKSEVKEERKSSVESGKSENPPTDGSVSSVSDSDEEDIREYLPADITSMSEVFNSSLRRNPDGSRAVGELYASVPKPVETEQVIETITSPPSKTIVLPNMGKNKTNSEVGETRPSRPDLIDCHDRAVSPPLPPPPSELELKGSELSGEDTAQEDDDNVTISDDGDSGPPLPSRNYNHTLTKDDQAKKKKVPTATLR